MLAGWLGLGGEALAVVETVGLGSVEADFLRRLESALEGVAGACPAVGSTT